MNVVHWIAVGLIISITIFAIIVFANYFLDIYFGDDEEDDFE